MKTSAKDPEENASAIVELSSPAAEVSEVATSFVIEKTNVDDEGPEGSVIGVGAKVGFVVGFAVGAKVGFVVGFAVGAKVGFVVGFSVGAKVGFVVGFSVGATVGCGVGEVGSTVGEGEGAGVGSVVGSAYEKQLIRNESTCRKQQ
jgi:hypothetical protein